MGRFGGAAGSSELFIVTVCGGGVAHHRRVKTNHGVHRDHGEKEGNLPGRCQQPIWVRWPTFPEGWHPDSVCSVVRDRGIAPGAERTAAAPALIGRAARWRLRARG